MELSRWLPTYGLGRTRGTHPLAAPRVRFPLVENSVHLCVRNIFTSRHDQCCDLLAYQDLCSARGGIRTHMIPKVRGFEPPVSANSTTRAGACCPGYSPGNPPVRDHSTIWAPRKRADQAR